MIFKNETVAILYGSQTGNAQDIAERIWRESKRYHFTGSVKAMNDYSIVDLVNERCVIFVCSTTGQGEEPDNMKTFWKYLLRKNLTSKSLANLNFAVLGLGDSSYVKFNFAAKRLNRRLMQLGAQMLIPLGCGDDQHDLGYDAAVDPWIESLWSKLLEIYPLPRDVQPLARNSSIKPRWNVSSQLPTNLQSIFKPSHSMYCTVKKSDNLQSTFKPSRSMYCTVKKSDEFTVVVKDIIRTTSDTHFQDVRLIKLQTNGQLYSPGDVVVIRPINSGEKIKEFLDVLEDNGVKISPDCIFSVQEASPEMPVPPVLQHKVTFHQLCEQYFDLSAIPRRYTFSILAQLTDSALEKEKCLEFTTAEGQDDLYNYCNRPKRNIVEVLQDFPHATKNITPEILFEILSPIKPRDFSIASSCKMHTNEIHILLAVVNYKTKLVKPRLGLCSNYLANLKVGDNISVWLKKGSFAFPEDKEVPVIMIGPGTGMAPFRSYIFECYKEGTADKNRLIFFFGCRSFESDFHGKEEFLSLKEQNKLNIICAFSRDQEHKVYVQHKIEENGETVWNALKNGAFIFVAGNSKNMPQQVRETFLKVCETHGSLDKEQAENFISQMEKKGRYQTETWS